MFDFLQFYYLIFGLLTLLGGIMGYARKKSVPSLVAGSICGALLIAAGLLIGIWLHMGLWLGLIASIIIAGKFLPDFVMKRTFFPAGIMALLSAIAVALTIFVFYSKGPNVI